MNLKFPEHFFWGTSTSAAQVETAFAHQWKGLEAFDQFIFERTTDHEKQRFEDAEFIKQLGSVYRCSVDWSRLQSSPYADFDLAVVEEYQHFFAYLNDEQVRILFVMHHFANPQWFEDKGGWLVEENVSAFVDFARQCIHYFGSYVFNWNTFNEPNVYALCAYMIGRFPPFKKSVKKANQVLANMALAHKIAYRLCKDEYPKKPVSISLNTASFGGSNFLGKIPALISNWWFNLRPLRIFPDLDYWGLSYYAYIPFTPFPVTEIDKPGKLDKMGIPHDKMWGYRPAGFARIIRRLARKENKPVIILENGICTDDSKERIKSIQEYLTIFHNLIGEGIDIQGYIHWSTWDNFEWNLGPSYRFGLVKVNLYTKQREMTEAGRYYAQIAKENVVRI